MSEYGDFALVCALRRSHDNKQIIRNQLNQAGANRMKAILAGTELVHDRPDIALTIGVMMHSRALMKAAINILLRPANNYWSQELRSRALRILEQLDQEAGKKKRSGKHHGRKKQPPIH